jgi:hypothetical protein
MNKPKTSTLTCKVEGADAITKQIKVVAREIKKLERMKLQIKFTEK